MKCPAWNIFVLVQFEDSLLIKFVAKKLLHLAVKEIFFSFSIQRTQFYRHKMKRPKKTKKEKNRKRKTPIRNSFPAVLLGLFLYFFISLFLYFFISLFLYFLISLFPYFLISLFPYFLISLFSYFFISLFLYFFISLFRDRLMTELRVELSLS